MELDVADLYAPRCCLCFADEAEAAGLLGQITCGHVYCGHCLFSIQIDPKVYLCPVDGCLSYTAWTDSDLFQAVRTLRSDFNQSERCLAVLTTKINYKGVMCRWEHRKAAAGSKPCPYLHAFNPLAEVECRLGGSCWRKEVCPMLHCEQKRFTVQLKAKSIANSLFSNEGERLKSVLNSPICQFKVEFPAGDEIEQVNWCFLSSDLTLNSFETSETALLEAQFASKSAICRLKDGSLVSFQHMLQIAPNGDFRPVARIPYLTAFQQVARVEITCSEGQHVALDRFIREITAFCPASRTVLSTDMLAWARELGFSIDSEQIIGTKEAISAVSERLEQYKVDFPHYCSFPLPPDTDLQALQADFRLQSLLFHRQFAYGVPEDVALLEAVLPDFEYSVACPAGVEEYDIALLCSELGLCKVENRLIGRKEAVLRAIERLTTEKTMIPADANEEDLVIALSMHTSVEVAGQTLQGPKDEVAKVLDYLQKAETAEEFPTNLPYQTVQTALNRYPIRLDGNRLIGTRANVTAALQFLTQEAAAVLPRNEGAFQYHVLPDWYANLDMDVYASPLFPGSEEYQEAEQLFMKTMRNQAHIVQIHKIFNKKLYTNFAYKHESKSQVEGKRLEIMPLFHGSRAVDPSVIFMSEEGLDSRLGGGMWGNGTYYAKNASYSHGFAFHTAAETLQMFLCDVLVGDYIAMGPQAMVKPPPKAKNSSASYHSVKGNTGGSDIWITYEVSMSYPKYLIEYRTGPAA